MLHQRHKPLPMQKPRHPPPTAEPALPGPPPAQTAVRNATFFAAAVQEAVLVRRLPEVKERSNPKPTSRTFALSWRSCMLVPTKYWRQQDSKADDSLCGIVPWNTGRVSCLLLVLVLLKNCERNKERAMISNNWNDLLAWPGCNY